MAQIRAKLISIVCGINFIEIGIVPSTPGLLFIIVAGPNHLAGFGIIFHSLTAHGGEGVAILIDGFQDKYGLIHGIQSEGIDLAGTKFIGIEGAVLVAGQCVDIHAHLADHGQGAHHLVYGVEHRFVIFVVCNTINHVVSGVVGHVLEYYAQITHANHIGKIAFRHDIQIALCIAGKYIVIIDSRCGKHNTFGFTIDAQVPIHRGAGERGPIIIVLLIEGDHIGHRRNLTDLHPQFIGGDIVGIVVNLHQELGAVGIAQIQFISIGLTGNCLILGTGIANNLLAGAIVDGNTSHIPIVQSVHPQSTAFQIHRYIGDLGSGAVHSQRNAQLCAVV